ncbi:hypothetical protein Fot_56408 [Forsythia ovata]|uniref:Uncharacterized protein n=1 Tax=Forsythia ovata TaxID=205694 RepID=A0ABD1P024_9LAMI
MADFSKRFDLANQAQEIAAKALVETNAQKESLMGRRITQLEEANAQRDGSQFEFTSDYENLQAFFVNFGARQVLTEVKELHPNLDLSTIESNYPSPKEVEDDACQPPADGAEDLTGQPPAEGA